MRQTYDIALHAPTCQSATQPVRRGESALGTEQVADFAAESAALADLLAQCADADWDRQTQFKGWTVNDVLVHLHFWNVAVDTSLTDPAGFQALLGAFLADLPQGGMRPAENKRVAERGPALLTAWQARIDDMVPRWSSQDPKHRIQWAGPDMSVRSAITARQMETWAHAHEVFDLMGVRRDEADRLKNIVVLGVNTYGWTFQVQGLGAPPPMPYLLLTAPSGAVWTFGEESADNRIEGSAVGFAQTVTQTRNVADTDLAVTGAVAETWMRHAQCFAGPPEAPPAAGTRHVA